MYYFNNLFIIFINNFYSLFHLSINYYFYCNIYFRLLVFTVSFIILNFIAMSKLSLINKIQTFIKLQNIKLFLKKTNFLCFVQQKNYYTKHKNENFFKSRFSKQRISKLNKTFAGISKASDSKLVIAMFWNVHQQHTYTFNPPLGFFIANPGVLEAVFEMQIHLHAPRPRPRPYDEISIGITSPRPVRPL